ncbi:uncharacterized protein LOC122083684 [Macadamia integrifolia]|uniref:uncharacterized protein LOC122083684 n=1 Tax=Macadamia integrifolia TaxID=60698 RepID=UPI001C4F929C|nr:uncharacterized protein LOC122083684 [Macadamia integrifolia]
MESEPVNWEALDSLVIDFAKSENLIEDLNSSPSSTPSSPSSSSYRFRLLIREIRRSLEIGDIDASIEFLRIHAPFILDDHRLLFRLHKQKFIELLRKGTTQDRDSAIECLRTALAPCALDAYPEAYEEFKHVLLALIFDKDDQTSPVAHEWSIRRRVDLAGLLSSVLRANLQAYDPIFSMTLRYLISVHKGFCFNQGISSPISDLTERLLLEERDLPVTSQESLHEAPPFDEVDIQALAHAVELTRQGAVDSLRFAKGDLYQAFQNDLCRMKLDAAMLDELVHEYCLYRGIVDSGLALPSDSDMQTSGKSQKLCQPDPGCDSPQDCVSVNMDYQIGSQSDAETFVVKSEMVDSQEVNASAMRTDGADIVMRCTDEAIGNREDCSTSGTHQSKVSRGFQRSRSYATGERSGRKRWRGRVEKLEIISDDPSIGSSNQMLYTLAHNANIRVLEEQQASLKHSALELYGKRKDHKYETVLDIKELASKGMAAEVVEEVNAFDPHFFAQNPLLLFQLKQVEFLKLVKSGEHSNALKVASSYLGPLAANDRTLLKPLKETLLALLKPNEDALAKDVPLSVLTTSLQV